MGGLLTHPVTIKHNDSGEKLGLRYGLSSMQGWRTEMEDAHDVRLGLEHGLDDWSFFAVFDGHAGKRAAMFAACNLLDFILRDEEFQLGTGDWTGPVKFGSYGEKAGGQTSSKTADDGENDKKNFPDSVDEKGEESHSPKEPPKDEDEPQEDDQETDHQNPSPGKENLSENQEKVKSKFIFSPLVERCEMVKNAIKSGFLNIDQFMRLTDIDMSGCTAVCSLISPEHIFIANCGDSRAVLYNGLFNGHPKFVTVDHKPYNSDERKRIVEAGGIATQRINGTLAVSRALGDFEYKKDDNRGPCEQLVSPEPEITILERDSKDQFLILACDGIWDVMTSAELCMFVSYKLRVEPNLENVCSSVLDVCLRKGSRDNMSIILVVFENGPKASKEEIDLDKKNDEDLLKIAESNFSFPFSGDFSEFLVDVKRIIYEYPEVYLPPGGGIEAKYDLFREKFFKNAEIKPEEE